MKSVILILPAVLIGSCRKDDSPTELSNLSCEWLSRAPMPKPTQETTRAILNEKLYIVGGFDSSSRPSRQVQVYDPTANNWSSVASLLRPMHHISLAAVNGRLYLLGGYTA